MKKVYYSRDNNSYTRRETSIHTVSGYGSKWQLRINKDLEITSEKCLKPNTDPSLGNHAEIADLLGELHGGACVRCKEARKTTVAAVTTVVEGGQVFRVCGMCAAEAE